jgi:hypothetical protein
VFNILCFFTPADHLTGQMTQRGSEAAKMTELNDIKNTKEY